MGSKSVIELVEKIVTSTPNTCRTVLAIVLVLGVVIGGLWLLNANLTAGPISVTGRESHSAPPSCADGAAPQESEGSCAGR